MEEMLKQILQEIGSFRLDFNNFRTEVGDRFATLDTTITEHGKRLISLEQTISGHGRQMDALEHQVDALEGTVKKDIGVRLANLEVMVAGIKEEHGRMLGAILESKDIQRGEIDSLQNQSAMVEGTLKRAATQILNDLKEAK